MSVDEALAAIREFMAKAVRFEAFEAPRVYDDDPKEMQYVAVVVDGNPMTDGSPRFFEALRVISGRRRPQEPAEDGDDDV